MSGTTCSSVLVVAFEIACVCTSFSMGNGSCRLAHAHCAEGGFEVDQQQERWRHFRANPAHKMVVRDLLTL